MMARLSAALRARVLAYLQVEVTSPDLLALRRLMDAYVRRVPWESAFRISRRARMAVPEACARWPDRFWTEALSLGAGGTCFESNYAFWALLDGLGYNSYLTINNMGDDIGCHTAVVVNLEGSQWLADVGIPLYAPLELHPALASSATTPLMTFMAVPEDGLHYEISRAPHPRPYIFTLVNQAVAEAAYRAATVADYGPGGYFLDRVVISKVVDDLPWRFDSAETPPVLSYFRDGARFDEPVDGDVATAVAARFDMDALTIHHALAALAASSKT